MSVKAMSWVWSHSRSKPTQRLVLLAIADCANDRGREAYPSNATLMQKTGLSERGVRRAVAELEELGELVVQYKGGPHGCNRYRVIMADPARGAGSGQSDTTRPGVPGNADTRPDVPGVDNRPDPATRAGWEPVDNPPDPATLSADPAPLSKNPATVAPEPSEPSENQPPAPTVLPAPPAPAAAPTITQRSKRITDAYAEAEPMCRWPAINAIVIRAIKTERWTDDEIRAALLRLAAEGRSVTVDTVRIELNGQPPPGARASPQPSTSDQRVAAALAAGARVQAQLDQQQRLEIEP